MTDEQEENIRPPNVIDAAFIERKREHSSRVFGNQSYEGALDHLILEISEIRDAPGDVTEWADALLLALDGAWRAGHEPQAIIDAVHNKQVRNEVRTWQKPADPTKAIKHVAEPEVNELVARKKDNRIGKKKAANPEKFGLPPVQTSIFKDPFSDWHALTHDSPQKGVLRYAHGPNAKTELLQWAALNQYTAPRDFTSGPGPEEARLRVRQEDALRRISDHRVETQDWSSTKAPFTRVTEQAEFVRQTTQQPDVPHDRLTVLEHEIELKTIAFNEVKDRFLRASTGEIHDDSPIVNEFVNARTELMYLKSEAERLKQAIATDRTAQPDPTIAEPPTTDVPQPPAPTFDEELARLEVELQTKQEQLRASFDQLTTDPHNEEYINEYREVVQQTTEVWNDMQVVRNEVGLPAADPITWDEADFQESLRENLEYAPPAEVAPEGPEVGMEPSPAPEPDYVEQPAEDVTYLNGGYMLSDAAREFVNDPELIIEQNEENLVLGVPTDPSVYNTVIEIAETADGRYTLCDSQSDVPFGTFDTLDEAIGHYEELERLPQYDWTLAFSPELRERLSETIGEEAATLESPINDPTLDVLREAARESMNVDPPMHVGPTIDVSRTASGTYVVRSFTSDEVLDAVHTYDNLPDALMEVAHEFNESPQAMVTYSQEVRQELDAVGMGVGSHHERGPDHRPEGPEGPEPDGPEPPGGAPRPDEPTPSFSPGGAEVEREAHIDDIPPPPQREELSDAARNLIDPQAHHAWQGILNTTHEHAMDDYNATYRPEPVIHETLAEAQQREDHAISQSLADADAYEAQAAVDLENAEALRAAAIMLRHAPGLSNAVNRPGLGHTSSKSSIKKKMGKKLTT